METRNRVKSVIVPMDESFQRYFGFLVAGQKEYQFTVSLQESEVGVQIDFRCCEELSFLLSKLNKVLAQRIKQSRTLDEFSVELNDLVSRAIEEETKINRSTSKSHSHRGNGTTTTTTTTTKQQLSPDLYARLISELNTMSWDCVTSIDLMNQRVSFSTSTPSRTVPFDLEFLNTYPQTAPILHADLPTSLEVSKMWQEIIEEDRSIGSLLPFLRTKILQFEKLWQVLDDFDTNTWVLEPEHPSLSCCMRRVALEGGFSSIQIDFDPLDPTKIPAFRFLGIDSVIIPLRHSLNKNLSQWDPSISPRQNVETILETSFPSKHSVSKEILNVECGICYSYRLENSAPDFLCENEKCRKPFHQACLSSWLLATPESRSTFNTVFGSCPYCSASIHVRAQ